MEAEPKCVCSRGSFSGSIWKKVSHSVVGRDFADYETYNLGDIAATAGTAQAPLCAMPLVAAGMTVDNLATFSAIERTGSPVLGSHVLRLAVLVRSKSTKS